MSYIISNKAIQQSIGFNPNLPKIIDLKDENIALFAEYEISKSSKIREQIICRNRPLIISVFNRFYGKNKKYQTIREDLIQEGIFGLMTAVEKFDYKRGNKFSTYAVWWIRQSIDKYLLNNFDTIRTPIHINLYRTKAARFKKDFLTEHDRLPTKEETIVALGISEEIMDNIQQSVKNQNLCFLEDLVSTGHGEADSSYNLYSLLESPNLLSQDQQVVQQDLLKVLSKSLRLLTKRELQVLLLRYGIVETAEELHTNKFLKTVLSESKLLN